VAVARVAGISALGEYSLTYAAWLIVAALHRSLITDPMAIENDVNQPNASFHIRIGLAAELTLGLTAATAFGLIGLFSLSMGQQPFGIAFLTFAPFLPFLVVQDYWRWVAFMSARPAQALVNDTVFDVVQGAVFVLIVFAGGRSSVIAIVAWGVGALAGALFGLWQFRARPTLVGGLKRLRLRWGLSKWLVGTSVLGLGTQQMVYVLTAAILGPVGLGGFNAASSLISGPSLVLIMAGGSIGLPEAARSLSKRGWPGLRRVQRLVTLVGVLSVGSIAVFVLLFAKQLLSLIYGQPFARFASTSDILAVAFLVSAFRLGAILSLKITKQTRLIFRTTLMSMVISIGAAALLIPLFGVVGAAVAALVSTAIVTLTQLILHWRRSPPAAERIWESLVPASTEGLAPEPAGVTLAL